ncbi:hypothetical protein Zmor_013334 [Zophobas morio]|uniref:Uncharacterized protein n=1 Tax=Zophobas morio TaxID=2755281 RepID=A0AA38IFA2_9CUCU|nr:hypothetical protein Zmor_013334 [Zophobas morio]
MKAGFTTARSEIRRGNGTGGRLVDRIWHSQFSNAAAHCRYFFRDTSAHFFFNDVLNYFRCAASFEPALECDSRSPLFPQDIKLCLCLGLGLEGPSGGWEKWAFATRRYCFFGLGELWCG